MKPMSVMFLQLSTLTCRNSRNANVVENVESVRGTFPTSKNVKFKSSILEDEKEMCVTIWPKKIFLIVSSLIRFVRYVLYQQNSRLTYWVTAIKSQKSKALNRCEAVLNPFVNVTTSVVKNLKRIFAMLLHFAATVPQLFQVKFWPYLSEIALIPCLSTPIEVSN
jgi:hypothetical protein